jgi:hypothetical protein
MEPMHFELFSPDARTTSSYIVMPAGNKKHGQRMGKELKQRQGTVAADHCSALFVPDSTQFEPFRETCISAVTDSQAFL